MSWHSLKLHRASPYVITPSVFYVDLHTVRVHGHTAVMLLLLIPIKELRKRKSRHLVASHILGGGRTVESFVSLFVSRQGWLTEPKQRECRDPKWPATTCSSVCSFLSYKLFAATKLLPSQPPCCYFTSSVSCGVTAVDIPACVCRLLYFSSCDIQSTNQDTPGKLCHCADRERGKPRWPGMMLWGLIRQGGIVQCCSIISVKIV